MKAQAVRNIMEHFDREARKLLIDYTVNVGHENTPWTDDNLSSKKCLPGFQFLGVIVASTFNQLSIELKTKFGRPSNYRGAGNS